MFEDQLVFLKDWNRIAEKDGLNIGDPIMFKYRDKGFKIELFKKTTSTHAIFKCRRHGT
jgi:hypothetical protein